MEVEEPIQITRKNYKDFVYDIERRINEDNMNENENNMRSKMTSEKQLNHIKKMNEMRKIKKEAKKLLSNDSTYYYQNEIEKESKDNYKWNFIQNPSLLLAGIFSVSAGVYYWNKIQTKKVIPANLMMETPVVQQKEVPKETQKEVKYSNLSLDFSKN